MKTEDLLSLAEMVEFRKYLADCLSCDYDTMDEAQRHKAYELWQDSIKPEEGYYSEENYVYSADGIIYDRSTGEAVGKY